ncbi:MAG: hypothetical protein U0V18_08215 [Anaerolineales bacterium]
MDIATLEKYPVNWLETSLKKRNIPWILFILLICAFLFAIEASYSLRPDVDNFVGIAVYDVVIEAYALGAMGVVRSFLTQALAAIYPLIDNYQEITPTPHREWQYILGVGGVLTVIAVTTNPLVSNSLNEPTTWLYILSQLIENSLLGWIVFSLLASVGVITHFISQVKTANIFDSAPYRPIAHWCLVVEISIMGAVTIAMLFLQQDMMSSINLVTYIVIGILGVLIFFGGMWSTHQHMLNNKEKEISIINQELHKLHQEILAAIRDKDFEKSHAYSETSADLVTHRERIEKVPDWPYTIGSLGGLASSVVIPVAINFLSKII